MNISTHNAPEYAKRLQCKQSGLTLLEMIVVFLLISLLSTLLIQGVGYFLGQYQAVQRFQGKISAELLTYSWFSDSVQAMIPYEQSARRFKGDAHSFRGISMQALATESGLPVEVSWTISDEETSHLDFIYAEEGQIAWKIPGPEHKIALVGGSADTSGEGSFFEYADGDLNWHSVWPPSDASSDRVPSMIRLNAEPGQVTWLVNLLFYPRPVVNYRLSE